MSNLLPSPSYAAGLPSLTEMWVSALVRFGRIEHLAQSLKSAAQMPQKQAVIAGVLEQKGDKLISQGVVYAFDDLRKAVEGQQVLETALAKALGKAMPEILERRDYDRFLLNVDRAQHQNVYKNALPEDLLRQAGAQMLQEGYPISYQRLKGALSLESAAALDQSFDFTSVPYEKLRNLPISRLMIMMERNPLPTERSVLCQMDQRGGLTPDELVAHFKQHGKPGQAEVMRKILQQALEGMLQRQRTFTMDGKVQIARRESAESIDLALDTLRPG